MDANLQHGSPGQEVLSTGQVARRFKISLQTLHFYDDEGLVKPGRSNGRRTYDRASVNRLAFILEHKRLGLSLAEIAVLLANTKLIVAFGDTFAVIPGWLAGA